MFFFLFFFWGGGGGSDKYLSGPLSCLVDIWNRKIAV